MWGLVRIILLIANAVFFNWRIFRLIGLWFDAKEAD
jgi:hypothetical protein